MGTPACTKCSGYANYIFLQKLKRSAHWFRPVLPMTLIYWPPLVMLILSTGLRSNMQQTLFEKSSWFWYGVFCELLSRPFNKIKMTRGWGQWHRDFRKLGLFSCARYLEKSVHLSYICKLAMCYAPHGQSINKVILFQKKCCLYWYKTMCLPYGIFDSKFGERVLTQNVSFVLFGQSLTSKKGPYLNLVTDMSIYLGFMVLS